MNGKTQAKQPPAEAKVDVQNAVTAEKAATALSTPVASFDEFAGAGFEGTGKDDMAIPFLTILQSGSPECKRSEGAYIEGAQEGFLLNTVTREVIDPNKVEVLVIPCAYTRAFIEWRLRENGGGFVKEHKVEQPVHLRDDKSRDILANGNQINDTRTFYVMILDADGTPSPAVITMTSTQIKKAKQWMMQQNLLKLRKGDGSVYTPPVFASRWEISTVPESNDKGSWFGWKFDHAGYLAGPTDPTFTAAMEFHKSVTSGLVKADMAKAPDGSGGSPTGSVDPETGEVYTGQPLPGDPGAGDEF